MILSTILTSPTARVYNLRFLLLVDISLVVLGAMNLPHLDPSPNQFYSPVGARYLLGFFCGLAIFVHHTLAIFDWPMRGLASVDLGAVVIEIGVLVYLLVMSVMGFWWWLMLLSLPLGPLLISLLFRIVTVIKTKERFSRQRFRFLGCCTGSNPSYTWLSIILNRSLARPLVRGESMYIIVSRALVLSCVALGVPAFGIYSTVIMPLTTVVSIRRVREAPWAGIAPPSSVTIVMHLNPHNATALGAQVNATLNSGDQITCGGPPSPATSVEWKLYPEDSFVCMFMASASLAPYGWFDISQISIYIVVPPELDEVYVDFGCLQCDDRFSLTTPHLLLPGSHLFGMLTLSQRQQAAPLSPAFVYTPEIYSLQPDPSSQPQWVSGPRGASLTLRLPYSVPVQYFQDMADASPLSGIATFGGFWTFVNGAFALLFGANVVYFMSGRRPLSALGVVHLFQRRALVRRWHEDFPAIHTEGGLPGSENAGIVAFIRERLVDLDEDPRGPRESKDAEEQAPEDGPLPPKLAPSEESVNEGVQEDDHHQSSDDSPTMSVESYPQRPGYVLNEIPLLELDLGADAVTTRNRNTLVKHDSSPL
ncbi:hypothetical protein B0H14DRAFT_1535555 [Mycena olivaceomarginata]|nr:hypothetical protein B0H14DRAFT_1535555 [Mycena olivaceomarginata]